MNKLRVLGMLFQANHGCSAAEREVGATFRVDVELRADQSIASSSDSLEDAADVAKVYDVVRSIVLGHPRHLIETVAGEIASALLRQFKPQSVRVMVHKDRAPLAGPSSGYEVEIERP